jgi:hypothetical protein
LQNYVIVFIKKKDKQKFVYPFLIILNQSFHDYSEASVAISVDSVESTAGVSTTASSAFFDLPLRVDAFLTSFLVVE